MSGSSAQGREGGVRPHRALSLRHEAVLVTLPTALVLIGLLLVRDLGSQPLLEASLASSAVSVYLDPRHEMNSVKALILAQCIAAASGYLVETVVGSSIWSAVVALAATIAAMSIARTVHPPAASTALSFAVRQTNVSVLLLFSLLVGITAGLIVMQLILTSLVNRWERP